MVKRLVSEMLWREVRKYSQWLVCKTFWRIKNSLKQTIVWLVWRIELGPTFADGGGIGMEGGGVEH